MKTLSLNVEKLTGLKFSKVGQTPRSMSWGDKCWYQWKVLSLEYSCEMYERSSAHYLRNKIVLIRIYPL